MVSSQVGYAVQYEVKVIFWLFSHSTSNLYGKLITTCFLACVELHFEPSNTKNNKDDFVLQHGLHATQAHPKIVKIVLLTRPLCHFATLPLTKPVFYYEKVYCSSQRLLLFALSLSMWH